MSQTPFPTIQGAYGAFATAEAEKEKPSKLTPAIVADLLRTAALCTGTKSLQTAYDLVKAIYEEETK